MKSAVVASSAVASSAETPHEKVRTPASPLLLRVALGGGVLWLLLLAVLAWRTANPATLNLAQLYRSDAVVLAEVIDPETGTVSINEVLFAKKGQAGLQPQQSLKLSRHGSHWEAGLQRLLLLSQLPDGTWEITPTPLPQMPQLDYPPDAGLQEQIRAALTTPHRLQP